MDTSTNNAINALNVAISSMVDRIECLEREVRGRATVGDLTAQYNRISLELDSVIEGLNRVESKVTKILEPHETLAFIGVEDLRQIKTTLQQMIALKTDVEITRQQLVAMLAAYDMGQAAVIR